MKACVLLMAATVAPMLCASTLYAQPDNGRKVPREKIWEHWARTHYSELNEQLDGELEPLFSSLPDLQRIYGLIMHDRQRDRRVYQPLLVAAIEDAMKGDVGEGMFLEFLLVVTPPEVVVEAIVSEIEAGGRLEGALEHPSMIRPHVEDYVPRNYFPGGRGRYAKRRPDFSLYVPYLNSRQRDQHPALLEHMFRTDPEAALDVLMTATDSLRHKVNVRDLAFNAHVVQDVLWRARHEFEIEPQRRSDAEQKLEELSKHKEWWVRLYVAEVLDRYPTLRSPALIERLTGDEHRLVREAASRAAQENEVDADIDRRPVIGEPAEAP
ncbi:MAG: hypothetical protein KY475_05475 [Planctomycetes bacterium]|nr:hypothetical protein [Planctomycetota bacterium]